jgi:hypothetical protein
MADLQAGIRLLAGHSVVLVVADAKGTKRTKRKDALAGGADGGSDAAGPTDSPAPGADGGEKKNLSGTFRVGDHILEGVAFRLHKDSGEGPLITPDTLAGGDTGLRWDEDHWVGGDDGKYDFRGLPAGKYFVELVGGGEPA